MGWGIALASVTMVPTFAIVQYYHSTGTSVKEVSGYLYCFSDHFSFFFFGGGGGGGVGEREGGETQAT